MRGPDGLLRAAMDSLAEAEASSVLHPLGDDAVIAGLRAQLAAASMTALAAASARWPECQADHASTSDCPSCQTGRALLDVLDVICGWQP